MQSKSISLVLAFLVVGCQSLQYCHVDNPRNISACLAITTAFDIYSKTVNTHFLISAKFVHRRGWLTFGIGDQMADSIMFVLYPGRNPDQLTLSVRSADGHSQPFRRANLPTYEVQSITMPEEDKDIFNIYFTCETCASGSHALDIHSSAQSFIWAANTEQVLATDDEEMPLEFHKDNLYGTFELDMTDSQAVDATDSISLMPSLVRPDSSSERHQHSHGSSSGHYLRYAHGILASLSFLVFPIGVYLLKRNSAHSFFHHWLTQVIGFAALTIASILGLWVSLSGNANLNSAHQILGTFLTSAIGSQIVSGSIHHKRYAQSGRQTKATYVHVWTGRLAMPLGVLNVLLGLRLANLSQMIFVIYCGFFVLAGFISYVALAIRETSHGPTTYGRLGRGNGEQWPDYDVAEDFTIGDDESESSDHEASKTEGEKAMP